MGRSIAYALIGLALVACEASRVVGVACGSDGDCKLGSVSGQCEATGFCSYPDPECGGGRYSPGAGDGLGNTCVGACGEKDTPCCAGTLCSSDLACVSANEGATSTCACGDKDQPCCDGVTCGANLECSAASTCECGGIGEPCCGGSTCDTSLTCNGGTCSGGVLQVAVGWGATCALRSDRTVSCWGHNWKPYPFGVPGLAIPVIQSRTPLAVPGLADVAEIHAGEMHFCARKNDGTLWCWGHNENGQLGNGTVTSTATPVQVAGLTGVTLFEGGRYHTCAVGTVGGASGLWCWGHNSTGGRRNTPNPNLGRLGTGDIVDSSIPARVDLSVAAGAGQTVRSVSAGGYHTCAAMSDNRVWCWGDNGSGELGNGTTTSTKAPVAVNLAGVTIPAGVTIDEVSISDGNSVGSSCLRLSNGRVHCWGNGNSGQLGDGVATATRTAPAAPVDMAAMGGATFVEIASASQTHCGRASDGSVWCWGRNKSGLAGVNDLTDNAKNPPVQALGLANARQLDMSHRNACAVNTNEQLFCWGNNRRFQATAGTAVQVVAQPMQVQL